MRDIDLTDICVKSRWMYLVAVLDEYARSVVNGELDPTLPFPCVREAGTRTLLMARPPMWNSDHGSHCTRIASVNLVKTHGVQISMDERGRARETMCTEHLWRTIPYEEGDIKEDESPRHARQ